MSSDYHLYQVLDDTGIGLGDDGDPRMLRREFGSATEGRIFTVFFFKIQLGRRPPDALRRLLTLWWPVATHHSPIVCRFAAGSGAGDRGAGPAAGGPRPNPELGIEKPDRQPAARGCVRCWRIEEPAAGDITKAGSGAAEIEEPERQPVARGWVRGRAEESRSRSGSRRSTAGSPALEDREVGARGLDSPVMPAATNGPGSGTGRNRTLRRRLREISRELSGTYDKAPSWTHYTFSHCETASVQLRSADCIGVVSWDTTPTKVASYRHSAPL